MILGVIIGTVVVVSSRSWPFAWLGLELNLICFVPIAIKDETIKKTCIFYFIAQRIGSLIILVRGILSDYMLTLSGILLFRLVLKIGAIPLHFWVPVVVPTLTKPIFYTIQTWQKIAPVSLVAIVFLSKWTLRAVNVWVAAATILTISSPLFMVIFSGIVQIGWIFSLSGLTLWWFVLIYFLVLGPIIIFMQTSSRNFLLSLINGAGLPPFTGFIIKLKALKSLSGKIGNLLIMGRGLALVSYSRILLNHQFSFSKIRVLVLISLIAGIV